MTASGRDGARLGLWLLAMPLVLWLLLLVILPQAELLGVSFRQRSGPGTHDFTLANYLTFLEEPLYWHTFLRTAWMSLLATVLTLLLAFPVAFYIARIVRGRLRAVLFVACLIPFWVSELVRTYGWMILLRETGLISGLLQWLGWVSGPVELLYNDMAVMTGLVYASLLFMVVPLISVLDSLDDSLIEAAYDLGASHWRVMVDIVVPHALPGITSGCIMVFMLTLGNYLTPRLLGGKDSLWFTEQIYTQFITRFNWEQGAAFGMLLLVLSSLLVWLGLRLTGQSFSKVLGQP